MDGHPVPDFAARNKTGATARRITLENFDRLRSLPLDRIALSVLDSNRAEIDRVTTLMLGLPWENRTEGMVSEWRRMMCLRPVVNGGTKEVLESLTLAGLRT